MVTAPGRQTADYALATKRGQYCSCFAYFIHQVGFLIDIFNDILDYCEIFQNCNIFYKQMFTCLYIKASISDKCEVSEW